MRTVRPIRIEGDIAYVPLTQGHVAVIDAVDVRLVEGRNWHTKRSGRSVYAQAHLLGNDGAWTTVKMHTVITGFALTDHIDADGLNNRRGNLREATRARNNMNARRRADNKAGVKGVTWHKGSQKWRAQIQANGKRCHLGYYSTREGAHAAYCEASARLHGEFGRVA